MANLTSRALLAVVLLGGVRMLACTNTSNANDEVISTPGAPAPQGADPATPAGPGTSTSGGCEDFGALAATSLTADYIAGTPQTQLATFAVANRAVTTKVKVIAVGDAASLVGKSAVLGAGQNVNLSTCTHCVLVAIGCGATCEGAAWFYPRSGTATLTAIASGGGQSFAGSFENVELERVSIDTTTLTSTPMPTGECLRIKTLSFEATTAETDGGSTIPRLDSGTIADGGTSGGGGGGKGKVLL